MRYNIFWAFMVFHGLCAGAPFDTSLIPYRVGEKWGYCSPGKTIAISPRFTEAELFEGKLAMVRDSTDYCVISRDGYIIARSPNYISVINDGNAYVVAENSFTARLFDYTGKPLTGNYNQVRGFNKFGYAEITKDFTKHGLIDRNYKEVLTPAYGTIEFLSATHLKAYDLEQKRWRLGNLSSGVFSRGFDKIYNEHEGLLMIQESGQYGFADITGRLVIPAIYEKAIPEDVKPGEYYNESTYQHFNTDGFYNGLAVVLKGGKAGFIDHRGKTVIPFIYDNAFGFRNGFAWVKKSGKWGIINRKGRLVLPCSYNAPSYLYAKELTMLDEFHEGLVPIASDSLYGYADTNGHIIIPPRFSRACPFYAGVAAVYEGDNVGFIDHAGTYVISPTYQWVEGAGIAGTDPFAQGVGIALLHSGSWVIIDRNGNRLMPLEFDGNNSISFENGVADATSGGKRYVFDTTGQVLYTFPHAGIVNQYAPALYYDYKEKCYINIRTNTHYCEP